ncbi:FecR family protein [Pedobacter frigidisoli]|uniref:FecR family protein n=1 Tax=Pedobacter frigidisoli TaxID=2530455 RepID=A0A4R0NTF6_9SPHI|nr:FecR family protein [Pedobacter frigidisoli]TCD04236.1 FecR family protein [Pedobacter frigidisoli]
MNQDELSQLLIKYNNQTATPDEKRVVEDWYDRVNDTQPTIEHEDYFTIKNKIFEKVKHQLASNAEPVRKNKLKLFRNVFLRAAILLLALVGVSYYFITRTDSKIFDDHLVSTKTHIKPGGNNATLLLADGSQVILNEAVDGQIANQPGVKITKTKSGELIYSFIDDANTQEVKYNTVTTPRGGQYHLILVDGTNVWLNANSSIKFPTVFATDNRKVEVTGEVYLEVSKNKLKPFFVSTNQSEIKVLGTHFNINAYDEEEYQRTTLLEGSIEITKGNVKQVLLPKQQANISKYSNVIKLKEIEDLDAIIAWKNGYFQFEKADLKSVMRQISRWYDTDVSYNGQIPNKEYSGKVPRNVEVKKLIEMLSYTGIYCKIEKNQITVNPK